MMDRAAFPQHHPGPFRAGDMCGPYEIVRVLGSGGMAVVYEALSPQGESRALKVLKATADADSEAAKRFKREINMLAEVQSDFIVEFHQAGIAEGMPWLALELLQGETLEEIIRAGRALAPTRIARWGIQMLRGLREAHALGVIHRDVKPANVMIVGGQARLLDFGISCYQQWGFTITKEHNTQPFTPSYMAPEMATEIRVDARADLYQVGLVLYELMSGQRPYHEVERRGPSISELYTVVAHNEAPLLIDLAPHCDAELAGIVQRAIRLKPEERFQCATEFVEALETVFVRLRLSERDQRLGALRDLTSPTQTLVRSARARASVRPSSGARAASARLSSVAGAASARLSSGAGAASARLSSGAGAASAGRLRAHQPVDHQAIAEGVRKKQEALTRARAGTAAAASAGQSSTLVDEALSVRSIAMTLWKASRGGERRQTLVTVGMAVVFSLTAVALITRRHRQRTVLEPAVTQSSMTAPLRAKPLGEKSGIGTAPAPGAAIFGSARPGSARHATESRQAALPAGSGSSKAPSSAAAAGGALAQSPRTQPTLGLPTVPPGIPPAPGSAPHGFPPVPSASAPSLEGASANGQPRQGRPATDARGTAKSASPGTAAPKKPARGLHGF